jgi:8-oxo-dGTP pyrophosphatase MutT (NUDIX family)
MLILLGVSPVDKERQAVEIPAIERAITRKIVHRQAALCIFYTADAVLLSELQDKVSGARWHRPVGGGLEPGETPEQAVRRELMEELGLVLKELPPPLPPVDRIWPWKKKELHERAWLFLVPAADYPELSAGQTPDIVEPDGDRYPTIWRPLRANPEDLPPVSPPQLMEVILPVLLRTKL